MIPVIWPKTGKWRDIDNQVCDWLYELTINNPGEFIYQYRSESEFIYFVKEEDAVAFKLRFGF